MTDSKKLIYNIVTSVLSTTICYGLLPMAVLGSCNSGLNKRVITDKDSLTPIVFSAAAPLNNATVAMLCAGSQRWYDTALKPGNFNGGMLVAKNGQIVFETYNGNGHLNGHDVIDSLTPFHVASISKTFTAMAVLKLWQDGKLNIDDLYSKYFPTFNYTGITIRNLLSHRSGLPNYLYFMKTLGWNTDSLVHNQDVFNYLVTRKKDLAATTTAPNTHFTYCNTNFALLALLVEKVTSEKFPDFLQQIFFTPLQMKHTFIFNSLDTSKVNPSYDWRGNIIPFNYLDGVYGDKNVYTTPRDLLIWDRALSSDKIFTQKTLDEAYAPYSNEKKGIKNYGLGWRMNIYPNGKKIIFHNGWWHGNNAAFIRLIQDTATIIVVGNRFNKHIYQAIRLANLFGDYYRTETEDEENEPAGLVIAKTLPTRHSAHVASKSTVIKHKVVTSKKTRKRRKQ